MVDPLVAHANHLQAYSKHLMSNISDDLNELLERCAAQREELSGLRMRCDAFIAESVQLNCYATGIKGLAPYGLSDQHRVTFTLKQPVTVAIRAKAGTIAHELRSVLDGLACMLAEKNGRSTSSVYFPISKTKEIFETDGLKNKLKKLSEEDRAKIAALKPYRDENPVLFGLHEADRTRKHIRLGGCSAPTTDWNIGNFHISRGGHRFEAQHFVMIDVDYGPLKFDLSDLAKATVGHPVEIGLFPRAFIERLHFDVAYDNPQELAGMPLCETLSHFADRVEEILQKFA